MSNPTRPPAHHSHTTPSARLINAAQPLLGYLAGGSSNPTPADVSPASVGSGAGYSPSGMRRTASTSAAVSESDTGGGAGYAGDEEARRKEAKNLDSIIYQFYTKASQIITQARVTNSHESSSSTPGRGGTPISRGGSSSSLRSVGVGTAAGTAAKKSRNRWFNIELEENDLFRDELRLWKSVTSLLSSSTSIEDLNLPSMMLEVYLDVSDISGNQVLVLNDPSSMTGSRRIRVDLEADTGKGKARSQQYRQDPSTENPHRKSNIVLERWNLTLKPQASERKLELPSIYKHCIILFRALYTLVGALPTHELCRKQKRRTGRSGIKIGCRFSTVEIDHSNDSSLLGGSLPRSSGGKRPSVDRGTDVQASMNREDVIELDDSLGPDDVAHKVRRFGFDPIITPVGALDLSCRYRTRVDFSIEEIEALLSSRFIDEDFFKPTMRKYATSTGGSLPMRVTGTSPSSAPRPTTQYGSLASRPASAMADFAADPEEGAFVGFGSLKRGKVRLGLGSLGRTASSPVPPAPSADLARRPSIGTSHPFKAPSPGVSSSLHQRQASAPPSTSQEPGHQHLVTAPTLSQRYSTSPASVGPSSSLRYAVGTGLHAHTPLTQTGATSTSSSQLSYTKRSIPSSPTSPVAEAMGGISAMHITASPPGTRPVPVPGTSYASSSSSAAAGAPMSTSPTPSLIKRYSTSRYSRSFGQGSSSVSPGQEGAGGYWPAQSGSIGRRSRLSSTQSREGGGNDSSTISSSKRSLENIPAKAPDADDIRSFLGMLDSRQSLSILAPQSAHGPGAAGGAGMGAGSAFLGRSNAVLSLAQAEEKLRNLASSVYANSPVLPVPSPRAGTLTGQPSTSRPLAAGPSTAAWSRRSPASPDLPGTPYSQSGSPVEGSIPVPLGSGSVRTRASQPPMSNSIPEEESHHAYSSRPDRQAAPFSTSTSISPPSSTTPASGAQSGSQGGTQYPFPRYVSASMRRRDSSSTGASTPSGLGVLATRGSILPSSGQGAGNLFEIPSPRLSPLASSVSRPDDMTRPGSAQSGAERSATSDRQGLSNEPGEEEAEEDEDAERAYVTGEEQTMGLLDFSAEEEAHRDYRIAGAQAQNPFE